MVSTQRRWQAACPNCGAPVEFASAASASAVCSFCRSTLVRDGESLRKIGTSAELFEDYSPLQLGSAGKYAGEPFTIVGRLQISYAEGSWNEWHALFDAGKSAWLSEDNGRFVISFDAELPEAAPPATALVLGQQQILAGQAFTVAALTQVTLAAAQGELPRPPALGASFLVAELRNTQDEVGSLEYSKPEKPQWSLGRSVRLADLSLTGLREESSKTLGSRSIPCPNCGASLEPKLDSSKSIACPQCGSVVDISGGAGGDLAHYAQSIGVPPLIPLGKQGTLPLPDGTAVTWQVVGYQERADNEDSHWREYLLFNKTEGFAFLVDAEDGWSLVRPLTGAPSGRGQQVQWQGKSYALKYEYPAHTVSVQGEFYWQLKKDDVVQVADYAAGPDLLSREATAGEITWSQGRIIGADVVMRAFGIALPVRDARPSSGSSMVKAIIVFVIILIVIVLLTRGCSSGSSASNDCDSYAQAYGTQSNEYAQCLNSHGGGRIYPSGGGSWGGGSFGGSGGGGGHK